MGRLLVIRCQLTRKRAIKAMLALSALVFIIIIYPRSTFQVRTQSSLLFYLVLRSAFQSRAQSSQLRCEVLLIPIVSVLVRIRP